jgi:hypothetical protein
MTTEEKKEYNRQWRENNPDYSKTYMKKWRKSSNYEMVKYKLKQNGFYRQQTIKRKGYLKEYGVKRWLNFKHKLTTINEILGYEDFVRWRYIPKTNYKYAISDSGVVFDIKNQSIHPQKTLNKVKVVYLDVNGKIITLKVAYAVLYSFSNNRKGKRFFIDYIDGDWSNVNLYNLIRVYPLERLLNSQFYKDIKSVNFSIYHYIKKFKKNIDFSEL